MPSCVTPLQSTMRAEGRPSAETVESTIATMVLTPEIVDIAAGRPVLAAGGIASGRQMAAVLALGAAGVWCGSVWLASEEDVANQAIKAKFLGATSSDTVR